jgi:CelD/BcsL family acetyltransferase involved in cellulose biosynthesis
MWYKPAFSVVHAHRSPGEVLLAALFRYCRDHELRELDFTIGDDAFKSRFSNVTRRNQRIEVFRSHPLQCLGYAERVVWEHAKRFGITQRFRSEWEKLRKRVAVGKGLD